MFVMLFFITIVFFYYCFYHIIIITTISFSTSSIFNIYNALKLRVIIKEYLPVLLSI